MATSPIQKAASDKPYASPRRTAYTGLADALATYMPTGTISTFLVLSQLVSDGGKCHYLARSDGTFIKATNTAEVVLMSAVIGLLAIACFLSAFLKREVHTTTTTQVASYRFVSKREILGQDSRGTWFSGPRLWVHAIFSTLAFLTWSLTSVAATTCFYNLPVTVSRSISPLVAFLCGVAFFFLGPPSPDVFRFDDIVLTTIGAGQLAGGGQAAAPKIGDQAAVAPDGSAGSAAIHPSTNGNGGRRVNELSFEAGDV